MNYIVGAGSVLSVRGKELNLFRGIYVQLRIRKPLGIRKDGTLESDWHASHSEKIVWESTENLRNGSHTFFDFAKCKLCLSATFVQVSSFFGDQKKFV